MRCTPTCAVRLLESGQSLCKYQKRPVNQSVSQSQQRYLCSRSPKRPSNQSVSHSSAVCVLGQRSDQSVSHSSAVCVLGLSKQSRLCSRSVKAAPFVLQVCQSRAVCVAGLSKQSRLCSRSVKAELFVVQVCQSRAVCVPGWQNDQSINQLFTAALFVF